MKTERSSSQSKISPARSTTFEILLQVASKNSYASELLHSRKYQNLSPVDHGLATELIFGTLRWQSFLDQRIAQLSSQPLAKLDVEVLTSLRLGAYQLIYLERIPASAAVNESVELVKRARKHSAAPFVNAILRKIKKEQTANRPLELLTSAHEVAVHLAHPEWMVQRWIQNFGIAATREICAYDQQAPETSLRILNPDEIEGLQQSGIELSNGHLLRSARSVRSGNVTALPMFREGRVVIQDEASQLVALLLGTGKLILDCCAAPGGKTRILAERNPNSTIFAAELHPHRARLLRKLVRNQNVSIVSADARALPLNAHFDRVLADVPCSGTGTLSRNPDIKWRLRPEDLIELQQRQVGILRSAVARLGKGGKIVYASCSLEPEENEAVVETVLADHPELRVVDCDAELQELQTSGELVIQDLSSLIRGPYLRTIPGIHKCDGFFAAILERAT